MNDYTSSDADVVLPRAKEPGRIVVNLNGANVESFAGANIQTAAKRSGPAGVSVGKVGDAWRWKDRNAKSYR